MINHLKTQLQEIKKNPTTSSVRGFFMDVNKALRDGEISEDERAELIKELKEDNCDHLWECSMCQILKSEYEKETIN